MSARPDEFELAAIAAAYAIVMRARRAVEVPQTWSVWRRAARIGHIQPEDARSASRRSAWRADGMR